ncbi:phosphatidic acid phosphatase type 2/haloperoxidase [Truncatella angustata]|uniref:Phosphatidic acid phosphatase type 2/haloperoxidase n=1 Tax=Truncatella angustata TaxID=152316 RepID=A0A9P8RMI6_9PEZI|nr:phosphatidic acid phosphatase type 2/haloperoxidase [Truncatella angustata]KAH6645970.1 phosphatidic acid phosphatase type 2/haloperoxidase [Truncatella angustata]
MKAKMLIYFQVFRAGPAGTRTFPLTVTNTGEVVYPQFAYPYRKQFVAAWLATFLAAVIPIAVILLAQIRIRSFWDINNGIFGLLYALETSSAFQVMIKWLIGGLRPHFYDVCRPDPSLASQGQFNATGLNGVGYQNYMFTQEICTSGNQEGINNALESFPSGHSTTIFAGMVFLYLYLNAKLKIFSNYHPAMWKLILLYIPILGAVLVGGSLTVDQSHNWYDVLAGATIGTVFAFSAYRMVYASIWDHRINHIPLNRGSAFEFREGVDGSDFLFCERAGWISRRKRKSSELPLPVSSASNGYKNGHVDGHQNEYTNGDSNGHSNGHGLRHSRATSSRARRSDDIV